MNSTVQYCRVDNNQHDTILTLIVVFYKNTPILNKYIEEGYSCVLFTINNIRHPVYLIRKDDPNILSFTEISYLSMLKLLKKCM